jgi:hypothetical protein
MRSAPSTYVSISWHHSFRLVRCRMCCGYFFRYSIYEIKLAWAFCCSDTRSYLGVPWLFSTFYHINTIKAITHHTSYYFKLRLTGIEPVTYCLGGNRSILLSYNRKITEIGDVWANVCKHPTAK